ncbi:5-formyltetrahydrofolate cyclo-ligase [Paraburkholderia bonniea]|uniref:5-formyltetrahydrofolate cyclo-ligase n=1 Tax=Paraburkholderia bonniea TaxID=2152891 RepID=UPI001FE3328E|nr:5-formyltetrahydrofolate cyclo-ligase [Paraburkholderia bonniea]WJF90496.1 5-formyltetrahydrofolate cyclo-ligase [Paraburkholderia bonniea]WJF93811.1 5-formyltetrahydrofolate cyclo-ligase [Paraburkholderia bonniea]
MDPSIACNPLPESKTVLRQALLKARQQSATDPLCNAALNRHVLDALKRFTPSCVGAYWPLSGEFNLRGALAIWLALDPERRIGLPVIEAHRAPLKFHRWTPDMVMRPGYHDIPEPTSGQPVIPDLLFVPCVGFDTAGYRLGYGGGFYDRTLAAWPGDTRPLTIGLAYESGRLTQLPRQPHDIPLDSVLTETGWHTAQR